MSNKSNSSKISNAPTPLSLGYHMPAEWEPHEATWLSWPTNEITWPKHVPQVQEIFLQMITFLTSGEKVCLLVDDKQTQDKVSEKLLSRGVDIKQVHFFQQPTVDSWIRDYGPIFLTSSTQLAYTKWIFNAWGGKYDDLAEDNNVFDNVSAQLAYEKFSVDFVLEGGSIDVNGCGTLLTTEQCLLNTNRNNQLSQKQKEKILSDYLGVTNFIWLEEGIVGDDTDGHIDDIARFVNSKTVVCALEEDPKDENYDLLQKNMNRLKSASDQDGNKLNIVTLPMPAKVMGPEGRLPASYANFYIGNKEVLVPLFEDRNDKMAISTLEGLFPDKQVRGIQCKSLVLGLGAIHCVTQQQPQMNC